MEVLVVIGVLIVLAVLANNHHQKQLIKRRRESLLAKYQDDLIVDRIMAKKIWEGQTDEQLRDSLGLPVDIDQRVMKSKVRETWKYHQQGKNRFGLRITLENDLVVGWDQKN